ncbi:MAG: hypothetical protein JWO46_2195, partial [Nocardioidaceae bacterium]|nr:hypothetical protein [Nocardioidaceae bacterium]
VDPEAGDAARVRLRAAVSALARWCETAPVPAAPVRPRRHLFGSNPVLVAPGAAAPGRIGSRDRVTVVGGPLDAMARAHWGARVSDGAGMRWRRVWDRMAARDALEPGLDLAAVTRQWVDRVGAEQVELVLSPAVPGRDPVAIDLARRLNQVLAVRPARARAAVAGLPWPSPSGAPGLGVPAHRLRWATARAEQLADELAHVGCRTVGDPALVVPSTDPGVRRSIPAAATLDLAVEVLGRLPRSEVGVCG